MNKNRGGGNTVMKSMLAFSAYFFSTAYTLSCSTIFVLGSRVATRSFLLQSNSIGPSPLHLHWVKPHVFLVTRLCVDSAVKFWRPNRNGLVSAASHTLTCAWSEMCWVPRLIRAQRVALQWSFYKFWIYQESRASRETFYSRNLCAEFLGW
jgi:hypothetical protein